MSVDPTQRTVLITGAGGFIGRHLAADQLRRGHRVVALDRDLHAVAHLAGPGRLEMVCGDVGDRDLLRRALDGVDTVHHLAAAHLSLTVGLDEYRRVNVDAVRSLVELAAAAAVRRFVHCSTVGVYGPLTDPPANEATATRPAVGYESTKLDGERIALETSRTLGLPAVVLRPVWVYGPGCPRTEKLFRSISQRRFVIAGSGRRLRHCIYVRDMVEAFDLAATSEAALGRIVIVGDATAVPVRELICKIANVCGVPPPPSVPRWTLYCAALAAEFVFRSLRRQPPLSRRSLKFFTYNTSFDTRQARELLGFEPAYDLDSGLRATYRALERNESVPLPWPLGTESSVVLQERSGSVVTDTEPAALAARRQPPP